MMRRACVGSIVLVLAGIAACAPAWKNAVGRVELSPAWFDPRGDVEDATGGSESRRLSFTVPGGWHWSLRGQGFIATRDGVFLQQILVERIHIDQVDEKVSGAFPLAVWSSSVWPIRTARNLAKRFTADMPAADAAEVLLGSRGNDPGIAGLQIRKVVTRTIAGRQAFRASFDFRLQSAVVHPSPLYRSASCGFVIGDWFYGISYTAAAPYYFDRDAGAFETFLDSVRFPDE